MYDTPKTRIFDQKIFQAIFAYKKSKKKIFDFGSLESVRAVVGQFALRNGYF